MQFQECPLCGEHLAWPAHYCKGCGTPFDDLVAHHQAPPPRRTWPRRLRWPQAWRPAPRTGPRPHPAGPTSAQPWSRHTRQPALAGAGLTVLACVVWAWSGSAPAPHPPVTAQAMRAAGPGTAPPPAAPPPAPTLTLSAARAPAPIAAEVIAPAANQTPAPASPTAPITPITPIAAEPTATATAVVSATPADGWLAPSAAEALAAARAWFDADSQATEVLALRAHYADTVDFLDRGPQPWSAVQAHKRDYLQRWPVRHYALLRAESLAGGPRDQTRVALHYRWRIERDGHWRQGQAVTLLAFQRQDGQVRVVMERPG